MRTNAHFDKVVVDSANRPKSRFSLRHPVNTTAEFGAVQPLQCRKLVPNSNTVCNIESLIRTTPLVAPVAGDIKFKTWSKFVGMSDLYRNFGSFLTKQAVATASNIVRKTHMPSIRICDLSSFVLVGSYVTIYELTGQSDSGALTPSSYKTVWKTYKDDSNDDISRLSNILHIYEGTTASTFNDRIVSSAPSSSHISFSFPGYQSSYLVSGAILGSASSSSSTGRSIPIANSSLDASDSMGFRKSFFASSPHRVSLSKADYVVYRTLFPGSDDETTVAYAFKLSSWGKRFRKLLLGIGCQVDFQNTDYIDITPLFAIYKAYFDSFGLTLYQNYEQTDCNLLLRLIENSSTPEFFIDISPSSSVGDFSDLFCRFISSLGNLFVTEPQDYISAHQIQDAVTQSDIGFVNNIVFAPTNTGTNGAFGQDNYNGADLNGVKESTNHVYINKVNHTEVDAELLKILYKNTNRNTVAGRRIAELLRAGGYGKFVDEMKSSFIGYTELTLNISDINATSDGTNAIDGSSSILGETVGKGIGYDKDFNNKTFTYENDEFGYWITLCAVMPESSYSQGIDPLLYDRKPEDFYQGDFDSVGHEFSKRSLVFDAPDWFGPSENADYTFQSFGLIPRYSRYKVAKAVNNGDFSLRSTRDSMLPYILDKWMQVGDRVGTTGNEDATSVTFEVVKTLTGDAVPLAGNSWRYLNMYPWLASFDRIFTIMNDYSLVGLFGNNDLALVRWMYCAHNAEDGFWLFNRINMTTYAPMLPIEDSYGTTDENNGHGDMTVTKS